jgi:hypothetical protein
VQEVQAPRRCRLLLHDAWGSSQVSPLWLIPTLFLGMGIGAYVERWRWLGWAKRKHPDEVDVSWL